MGRPESRNYLKAGMTGMFARCRASMLVEHCQLQKPTLSKNNYVLRMFLDVYSINTLYWAVSCNDVFVHYEMGSDMFELSINSAGETGSGNMFLFQDGDQITK